MKISSLLILLACGAPVCAQDLTLSADSEPIDKPWKAPATLSYTREAGDSKSTIDAFLQYRIVGAATGLSTVRQSSWSISPYIHRDKEGDTPRDDRGVALGFSEDLVTDFNNNQGPMSFKWNAGVAFGKTLQGIDNDSGGTNYVDRSKDRETLFLSGFIQPGKTEAAKLDAPKRPQEMFFGWKVGLYSDHSSSGDGGGNGRLSGSMALLDWNFFPMGLILTDNHIGGYGFLPVLTLSAQIQHDARASGQRVKDTYKLYSAALTLEFDTLIKSDTVARLKPSLSISRSVGANLLEGRPYKTQTQIAFGLSF